MAQGAHLLYVEDDQEIGQLVQHQLVEKGYHVTWICTGEIERHSLETMDLAILDIMLPGLDGFTIGQRIKSQDKDLPILFLTARTSIEDKLKGLQFADDYMTKPFHPEELLLRIDILLRRTRKTDDNALTLKHLHINQAAHTIVDTDTNEEIQLTGKQYHIFQYFLQNLNQILTKEQIYTKIWKQDYIEGDKTLNVHIRYLRQKVEKDPQHPQIIETIRGLGYRVKL